MKITAALRQFVDDEFMRAPLYFEQVIDATVEILHAGASATPPIDRGLAKELPRLLLAQRQALVQAYARSLREQVATELDGARPTAAAASAAPDLDALSLVDEESVAIDVELSHAIEAIKGAAEYELRELLTFTAALAGDMDVASDNNPFRAETQARALWAAAHELSAPRGMQIAFMRHGGKALAQVMRMAYAGASSRLEATGIEPATYRTLILPAGARGSRLHDTTFIPDLDSLRENLGRGKAVTDEEAPTLGLWSGDGISSTVPVSKGSFEQKRAVDSRLIDLLTRLFDNMLANRRLPSDVQMLVSRMQPLTLRATLRDGSALENYEHPVWRFTDRLAFMAEILPPDECAERTREINATRLLVDHLSDHPAPDVHLFKWALQRLDAQDIHRLEVRCEASAERIEALQQVEDRLAISTASTLAGALDTQQLDTVPSRLLDEMDADRSPSENASTEWLAARRPGDWLRVFMQGRWIRAQLLWPGERGELWLLADVASDETWAVRRQAMLTLHAAHLIDVMQPRSLVRDAAKQVMRQIAPAAA